MGKLSNPQRSSKLGAKNAQAEERSFNTDANPTDFLVRSIVPTPLFIGDIKLSIPPFEAEDLTHENPMYVRGSRDLTAALDCGFLQRIDRKTYTMLRKRKQEKEQEAWAQEERESHIREKYGRNAPQLMDINSATGKQKSRVSTAGYANDSRSFVTAFQIASDEAAAKGEYLDPADFAEHLAKNKSNIISPAMLNRPAYNPQQQQRGNAYVAEADGHGGIATRRYAAKGDIALDLDQPDVDLDLGGMGESIDLELD